VQQLQVARLDDQALAHELERQAAPAAARSTAALEFARGCLGRALDYGTERTVQLQELVDRLVDGAQPLGPLAGARALLHGAADRADALRTARMFLALLRARLGTRLRSLAAAGAGPYPAGVSEPWATMLEVTLLAERDLELQIPPEQVLAALLLQCRQLRGGGAAGPG
jgi:hypothetical protein